MGEVEQKKDVAIRKRQMIQDSAKTMFIWVAGASVIVSFSLVLSWFLVQQIAFKGKVIAEKSNTASVLDKNYKAAKALTDNVRKLNTDVDLSSIKAKAEEQPLQVIMDALPADDNSLALGASIQNKLVGGVPNIKIDSFTIGEQSTGLGMNTVAGGATALPFSLTVSGDPNAIKTVLERFESSIRTIDVDNVILEQTDTQMNMTIRGHGFYLKSKVIQLTDKVKKP